MCIDTPQFVHACIRPCAIAQRISPSSLPCPQDPLGMGRSTESANGRSLAITYNSLSKVLLALRNSAPATAAVPGPTGAAAAALAAGSQTGLQQLQRVPWRDSALTRWLQDRLHAAKAITLVGTVSAAAEVGAGQQQCCASVPHKIKQLTCAARMQSRL